MKVKLSKIYKFLIGIILGDGWLLELRVMLIFEEVIRLENGGLMAAVAVIDQMEAVFVFFIVLLKHFYAFLKVRIFARKEKGGIIFFCCKVI